MFQWNTFLAYFPEMKVGLSNRQSVCESPTNNFWTAWYIFMKSGAQGDLDAIIFNPITLIILKGLRLKFQIFRLAQQ
jgi:hypothetical protein